MVAAPPKISWADDAEEDEVPFTPLPDLNQSRTETTDPNTGVKTIVEFSTDDQGRKIKTTRQVKLVLSRTLVSHAAAERKHLPKFGEEKGKPSGPDSSTTTLGEQMRLQLRMGGTKPEPAQDPSADLRQQLSGKTISCRICQGGHYTTRCPYRDTLGSVLGAGGEGTPDGAETPDKKDGTATPQQGAGDGAAAGPSAGGAGGKAGGGKYVPPSMRGDKANRGGETMNSKRDDLPTLRVTNLSEDTREEDVWDLFTRFGKVTRVYCGMDQETNTCKGFAFVTFEDKVQAERAVTKVNGMPYDHLILSCAFSAPRGERENRA